VEGEGEDEAQCDFKRRIKMLSTVETAESAGPKRLAYVIGLSRKSHDILTLKRYSSVSSKDETLCLNIERPSVEVER
jgi:hypothetical protein